MRRRLGGDKLVVLHPCQRWLQQLRAGWAVAGRSAPLTTLASLSPAEERRAREWPLDPPDLPEGHLEDWLEKRAKRLSSAPSSRYTPKDPSAHDHGGAVGAVGRVGMME